MDDVRFVTTGFVTKEAKGPLSITFVTPDELVVVDVLGNTALRAAELATGKTIDAVLKNLWSVQKTETRIPLARIKSLSWIDGYNAVRIDYQDPAHRRRSKTTYISQEAKRDALLAHIERQAGYTFRRRTKEAGFWKLAWSQMLGAVCVPMLGVVLIALWDPEFLSNQDHGWILLTLGPTGTAIATLCGGLACLVSAWRRVYPRPIEHQCVVA
jgi:hypothetical protein